MARKNNCPFYGFYMQSAMGVMLDQSGNQCALITDSYSPCRMEVSRQNPDWKSCSYFHHPSNVVAIKKIANSFRVFPKAASGDSKTREGVPLANWMQAFS